MPLPFAPAGLTARALFYSQLAALIRSGVPLTRILEQLVKAPPDRSLRPVANALLLGVSQGRTLTESIAGLGTWAPPFDLALIDAGERSGRIDQAFQTLSRHHREHAANLRLVLQACAYPAFVLHVAVFVVPLAGFIRSGSVVRYAAETLGPLALLYGLVGFLLWALHGDRNERWRSGLERILLRIPLLGSARADLALARLAGALEALVSAGILVTEAWPLAAAASGSPLIRRTVAAWPEQFQAGRTPGELAGESTLFPQLFVSSYQNGELTGRLDEQLVWLARHHEEEGFQRLRQLAVWSPRFAYGLISVWIIAQIFALAGAYTSMLDGLLGE